MGPHVCDNCGHRGEWGPGWTWFGSFNDLDNGAIVRLCSPACRNESTLAELDQLIRRRRKHRPVGPLLPLRSRRTTTQEALDLDLTEET